jgi:23S rRNA pseudouridine1911/1915/1917 synthase
MERVKLKVTEPKTLIEVVAQRTLSKKRAKRLIDSGLVSVNSLKELSYRRKLKPNQVVAFPLNLELFKRAQVELLKCQDGIWAFNKPPFISSNLERGSLEELIKKEFNPRLRVVHRLDKQTSGVILAVEDEELFELIKEEFRRKKVKKLYLALLKGRLRRELSVNSPLDGKEARTLIRPIKGLKGSFLAEVEIETGRKHQIRRHGVLKGYPVVGEFKYFKGPWREELLFAPRLLLHSYRIELRNPKTGKIFKAEAPMPGDFSSFLEAISPGK